jgi:LuxR family maltose regulon positive regulatory protein
MGESDVRQPAGQLHRASGPALDLVASKLLRPLTRPGTIHRSALIERLANGDPRRIVAPPGYGKTTLLSQWAERNGQAFAWVSVDESDNDPKVLLSYVAEALDAVEPINGGCSTRSPPRGARCPARSSPGSARPSRR